MHLLNVGVRVCIHIVPLFNLSPVGSHFSWVRSAAAPFSFVGSLHFILEVLRPLWVICCQWLESISVYFVMIQTAILLG
jgi:hypothetical protein